MKPENQLPYWINRLGFVLRRDLQNRFRKAGFRLGVEEWPILLLLWQADNRTTGELASITVKDQTTMTRLLDGMVRKGLLTRRPDDKDRRKVRVSLTDGGRAMEASLVPIAAGMIADSQQGIDATDLEVTRRTLRRMTENMLQQGD